MKTNWSQSGGLKKIFLSCDGVESTLTDALNIDGHQILYLKEPEQSHNAATKQYTDTKLPLQGGDMQGNIGMGGHLVRHLGEPHRQNDAIRKSYGDENLKFLET